jgi:hypothetical protein
MLPPLYAIESAAGRACTNHGPAQAAEHGGEQQLPGGRGAGPAEDADGQQHRAGLRHPRDAESTMQRRQVGGGERADQKVGGDRRRNEGERPIARCPKRM